MSKTTFSAEEILKIARRIESNGARFYRAAAEKFTDESLRELVLSIAEMEDQHERIFKIIQSTLLQEETGHVAFPDSPEGEAYLNALADGYVFDIREDLIETLAGYETIEEILRKAIDLEKDSIIFYLGLKDMVRNDQEKARIDEIIREEMDHITTFSRHLETISGKMN